MINHIVLFELPETRRNGIKGNFSLSRFAADLILILFGHKLLACSLRAVLSTQKCRLIGLVG